jgi:hypothetical protein
MAQRISRAKRTVSGVRFDQPGDVATVLRVLYLVFNEGYSGDVDLAAEAIRLTRQLAATIDDPEAASRRSVVEALDAFGPVLVEPRDGFLFGHAGHIGLDEADPGEEHVYHLGRDRIRRRNLRFAPCRVDATACAVPEDFLRHVELVTQDVAPDAWTVCAAVGRM